MNKWIIIYYVALLAMLGGCKNEQNGTQQQNTNVETLSEISENTYIVRVDKLQLRETPGPEGKPIMQLPEDMVLRDLGEISDFSTPINIRGIAYNEPWIKVATPDGKEGWVYAGAVNFGSGATADRLIQQRLQFFFGKSLTDSIKSYQHQFKTLRTSAEFAAIYHRSHAIRDSIGVKLGEKMDIDPSSGELPDMFWLEQVMPGYIVQLVAEGTQYYLFADYHIWQKKSNASVGDEDDDFMKICLLVHSQDSIEYFYPSWFLQTWDYGGHSLLGQGVHYQVISLMDSMLHRSDMFQPEMYRIQQQWLNDICSEGVSYWEPKEKIIQELDKILKKPMRVLIQSDRAALQTRRKMFENPSKNDIKLNQRAGDTTSGG